MATHVIASVAIPNTVNPLRSGMLGIVGMAGADLEYHGAMLASIAVGIKPLVLLCLAGRRDFVADIMSGASAPSDT